MPRKEKKYHYVYKTTDIRNGNFYIGIHSTNNLNDGYVGSGVRIRNLKYKYGKIILKLEILEFSSNRKLLIEREVEIINSDLLKEKKCLNLKKGGYGGFSSDNHRNKFFKRSREYSKLGNEKIKWLKENDEEWVKNLSIRLSETHKGIENFKGKTHTEETKRKIGKVNSIIQKGEKNSQYGTCWITNGTENKKIKLNDLILYENNIWYRGRAINKDIVSNETI